MREINLKPECGMYSDPKERPSLSVSESASGIKARIKGIKPHDVWYVDAGASKSKSSDWEVLRVGDHINGHKEAMHCYRRHLGRYTDDVTIEMLQDDIRALFRALPVSGLIIKD